MASWYVSFIYCIYRTDRQTIHALHSDKQNPQDDQQLALEKFRQVTNAYEILSDEKERQWYDSRLRRQQKSSKSSHTTQGPPDVFSEVATALFEREYMTGHFSSFDTFAPLLQKIAILENGQYPDYEECPVQMFYAEWGSFATSLDFAWVTDTISATQKVDRRVRRAIDQEIAKERKQARREYNENIRIFIEFIKKRDPKYRAWHALHTREKEEKEAAARREKEEREKAKKERKNKMCPLEIIEDEIEEEEELHDVWYCPACEKYFKSSGSFSSHEKSKKHMKNVEIMKQVLLLEDQDLSSAFGSDDTRLEEEAPQASNGSDTRPSSPPPSSVVSTASDNRLEADEQTEAPGSQKMEKKQNKKKRRDKTKVKKKVGTLACNVCSAEFTSRNQLFKHIKETGHACSQPLII